MDCHLVFKNSSWYFRQESDGNTEGNVFKLNDREEFLRANLYKLMTDSLVNPSIDKIYPTYLYKLVQDSLKDWISSAVSVKYGYTENKDYMISDDKIAPVDYQNTGTVQKNTIWQKGVHLFLQLKHSLKICPDNLTPTYVYNLAFFKRYKSNLNGLTGTLGSDSTKKLLSELYYVDTIIIPTFKQKQYFEFSGMIAINNDEHYRKVAANAILEAKTHRRAVLIINKPIHEAQMIYKKLRSDHYYPADLLHIYSRNDDAVELSVTEKHLNVGNIY
jgi:preprotein translocase subunit SecA